MMKAADDGRNIFIIVPLKVSQNYVITIGEWTDCGTEEKKIKTVLSFKYSLIRKIILVFTSQPYRNRKNTNEIL